MRDVVDAARSEQVRVREVDREDLDALADDHRGVAARILRTPRTLGERDLSEREWAADAIVVVLDGVEDPQNLGAAARSIEAAGGAMLVTRTHRSAPPTAAAIRASAGALLHLPHARVANLSRALDRLRDAGFTTIGLDDEAPRSIFDEPCPDGPCGARRRERRRRHLAARPGALRSPGFPADAWQGGIVERGRLARGRALRLRAGGPRRERRMNDEPGAAPEPHEPPPGRSRYEDFDLADLQAGPQARPPADRAPHAAAHRRGDRPGRVGLDADPRRDRVPSGRRGGGRPDRLGDPLPGDGRARLHAAADRSPARDRRWEYRRRDRRASRRATRR